MASRRRNLVANRRRVIDEGEEEVGSVSAGDDTNSENSLASGEDESMSADESNVSNVESTKAPGSKSSTAKIDSGPKQAHPQSSNKSKRTLVRTSSDPSPSSNQQVFEKTAEMDAMMNGLHVVEDTGDDGAIEFQDSGQKQAPGSENAQRSGEGQNSSTQGQTRAKKPPTSNRKLREGDSFGRPSNIGNASLPNRRGGMLSVGRGGPGRSSTGTGSNFNFLQQSSTLSSQRWDHDLHETVAHLAPSTEKQAPLPASHSGSSLSKTVLTGTVTIRVSLEGMKEPAIFEKIPVKQHTRLPDLRPPLRRDKPVRIALPNQPQRYIFPSPDRSFIFIPRAQRPNQQLGRVKGRGSYSQYGSRRSSIYGGSQYTPSIAMSRRSSMMREGIMSPAASTTSRPPMGIPTGSARPIVKFPAGARAFAPALPGVGNSNGTPNAAVSAGQINQVAQPAAFHYPQPATLRENRPNQIPMHQPRPQKTVSVATIESPSPDKFPGSQQQEQQPFHHQFPHNINGQPTPLDQVAMGQSGHMPFAGPQPGGTPSSNIPERAVNAQPFQPGQQQAVYYQPSYAAQSVYYSPRPENQPMGYGPEQSLASPMYMHPQQQGSYLVPMMMAPPPPAEGNSAAGATTVVPYEVNGTVYYQDPQQMTATSEESVPFYSNMPGTGDMMSSPPPQAYYYAPAPPPMMYYPTQ
ncbi:MAG: hypothetical protein M1831_004946 [Alyxoria varia]|nr:MAG: hypothetical protein M1831_004946 [Alyxoria varia]